MKKMLLHGLSVIVVVLFGLLALGSGTTERAVQSTPIEPDITKTVDVSFDEFLAASGRISSSTMYSFDAYIQRVEGNFVYVRKGPEGGFDEAIKYDSEKHPIAGRYKADQAYKFYVFVRVNAGYYGMPGGTSELYQLDGLMTTEEAAQAKVEKEKAEAQAKAEKEKAEAERIKALDERVKALAKGYTYHGVNEDDQSAGLFDAGALEDGHAYYVSGFMMVGGGSTAGVTSQTLFGRLGDPKNYHMIEYVNQKVKGEVVSAGQTVFGTLPVTVVVAGGKPPLRIPIVLGLAK
ncbi:hypothetical protein AGMMS49991_04150 [Spirochaetia bacterium]|nr:hypothetical protein AGMMS49991_04150 [Spirochaetia bacterium]